MKGWLKKRRDRIKHLADVSSVGDIGRRYFVMNAFDGALTMLGVVVGAVLSGLENPGVIIGMGLSGALAMGVSGFSGAYLTEKAERDREMKQLQRAMLNKMGDSIHRQAGQFASIVTSLVDGLSPAVAAAVVIMPFFFVLAGLMSMQAGFVLSIILTLTSLFLLGIYLARISHTNWLSYGFRMLLVGAAVAVLTFLLGQFFGYSGVH